MRPDMGGLRMTLRGAPDDFYLNDGGPVHARAVHGRTGSATPHGKPLAEEPESFGLGAKLVDLNGDGAPDLYVANDFEDTRPALVQRRPRHVSARRLDGAAADEQLGDGRRRRRRERRWPARPLRGRHAEQRLAPPQDADADAYAAAEAAGRHGDAAAAAAEHAVPQSGRRNVRRVVVLAGVQASGWSWSHDVPRRRPRRMAGHSRRERPSVGHHGCRRAGATAESA